MTPSRSVTSEVDFSQLREVDQGRILLASELSILRRPGQGLKMGGLVTVFSYLATGFRLRSEVRAGRMVKMFLRVSSGLVRSMLSLGFLPSFCSLFLVCFLWKTVLSCASLPAPLLLASLSDPSASVMLVAWTWMVCPYLVGYSPMMVMRCGWWLLLRMV